VTFAPRLDVLPAAQRALWPELASLPAGFVLYGGTGLALRLGHRESVDFDFFAHDDLPSELGRSVSFLRGAETLQEGVNTRTVLVRRSDRDVKVSLFGGITFGRVGDPDVTADGVVRVASTLDLAATKVKALLQRVEAKDYRDVDAVLQSGTSLEDMLGAARALFGASFNPIVARKALCYFEGGDLDALDDGLRARLVSAATTDHEATSISLRSPRLD
jgi:hypothetical protein